ncbi:MAG: hypothetical protein ABH986_00885 [archaeon]
MIQVIASTIVDAIIVIVSILLIKKIKPNRSNLLNLAFGTFWLGVAGIYFFAGLTDLSGMFTSIWLSRLSFLITISLAVIPVVCLALFLSAISFKGKTILVLPAILGLLGILYIYFIVLTPITGPVIGWTVKYYSQSSEAITLIQYLGYSCFTMVMLLALTAFRSKKTSTFIQFNSVAVSMGLFFLAGYLDLLGNTEIQTVLIRSVIILAALIGYFGFSPSINLIKLFHRFL